MAKNNGTALIVLDLQCPPRSGTLLVGRARWILFEIRLSFLGVGFVYKDCDKTTFCWRIHFSGLMLYANVCVLYGIRYLSYVLQILMSWVSLTSFWGFWAYLSKRGWCSLTAQVPRIWPTKSTPMWWLEHTHIGSTDCPHVVQFQLVRTPENRGRGREKLKTPPSSTPPDTKPPPTSTTFCLSVTVHGAN